MVKYTITKRDNEIFVVGHDQYFTDEERNHLWEEHKILYTGEIMAVWIEERTNNSPLVHLMQENDGCISWSKDRDVCFDSYWIDDHIKTLFDLKNRLFSK